MKRYLIQLTALSLLALVTGCQKERDGIDNQQGSQAAAVNISIDGLSIDATASRAVIADMPDFTANGFKIAGYYTAGNLPTDPDDPSTGTSGLFDDNIVDATPNVFDYQGDGVPSSGKSVIVPEVKEGKYQVTLSKWQLKENSYLSYFAWASNVPAGTPIAGNNPIQNEPSHGAVGVPYLSVTSGSASVSLNVDVVAAKSPDNANDVVRSSIDLDFKHVMTKLKFNVKNISSVDVTLTGAKILFAANKFYRLAQYSFSGAGTHVGTWGNYRYGDVPVSYSVTLTPTTLASKAAAVHLEELLIIPQPVVDEAISVELTYTIPNGTGTSTYTRTVPLDGRTFEQNTSYTYEISLNETQVSINKGRIGEWVETSTGDLPYVVGARDPNVLLLLDAYDPPYTHTDGAQYWLDRSGWNRHCKLVGVVTYDVAGKFYKFSGGAASYIAVPTTLPSTTGATFETIVRTTRAAGEDYEQKLFNFTTAAGGREMSCYLYYKGTETYYFDAGSTTSATNHRVMGTMPTSLYREFAMYSFSKSTSGQYVRRNLLYYNNVLSYGGNAAVDLSTVTTAQIGIEFKGDIKYFKISATAKTSIDANEYAALSKRHKVKNTDYMEDGLLFDLRGTDAPVGGRWVDRIAGISADAKNQYNASNKEYAIVNQGKMIFVMSPAVKTANFNNMTFELVGSHSAASGAADPDVQFEDNRNWGSDHYYQLIFQMRNWGYNSAAITTNMGNGWAVDASVQWPYSPNYQTTRHSYVVVRDNNAKLIVYGDNKNPVEQSYSGTSLPTFDNFILGKRQGLRVSAIRLYNRRLTPGELSYNYMIDKALYNLP